MSLAKRARTSSRRVHHVAHRHGRSTEPLAPSKPADPTAEDSVNLWITWLGHAKDFAGTVAILAIPIFAIRVGFVASFDVDVARALILNTSITTLINSTLLEVVPFIIGYVFAICGYYIGYRSIVDNWKRWLRYLALIPALLGMVPAFLVATFDSWVMAPFYLLLPGLAFEAGSRRAWNEGRNGMQWMLAATAAVLTLAIFALPRTIWLPAESATISGKATTIYVLTSSETSLVYFDPKKNAVVRADSKQVEGRQYCSIETKARSNGMVILGIKTGLSQCPK